jgi:DNA-binding PadR family transcriptional regulator
VTGSGGATREIPTLSWSRALTETYGGGPLKRIEFMVLAVLSEDLLHGYGIAQQISERTGGHEKVRPGSLYRVLDRLQRRGLLEKAERRPLDEDDDERRSYYRLTRLGRVAVMEEARILSGVAANVVQPGSGPAKKPA